MYILERPCANHETKTTNQHEAYVASLVFALCLGVPFASSWYRVVRFKESRSWHLAIPLLSGTFSYLLLMLCAVLPSAMGHSYTPARYHIIEINCAVSFVAAIVSFTRLRIEGLLTGAGCLLLTFSWIVVLVANSVV
jgi:hypothetical protein